MKIELFTLLSDAQKGDEDSMIALIEKFNPVLLKFAKKLNYEKAKTDLVIFFINLVRRINLNNLLLLNDGAIVNYIYRALYHQHINMLKKLINTKVEIIPVEDDFLNTIPTNDFYEDLLNNILLHSATEQLVPLQKKIIRYYYFHDLSDEKISKRLRMSRNSVYRNRIKALKILREILEKENSPIK